MPRSPLRKIKASAGSGKTWALTSDFLSLLAHARANAVSGCRTKAPGFYGWPEILAVTFTNRAAAEMRERLLDRLKAMALPPCVPEKGWTSALAGQTVESLLRDFGALNIRTIDSLLHLLARLAALPLALPPDFGACFDNTELLNPLFDDLAERAREDPILDAAFREACRRLLRYGEYEGFLAGNKVREHTGTLASFFLSHQHDPRLHRLASPEAVASRLGDLRRVLRESARALLVELEQSRTGVNRHLLIALNRCRDWADSALPPPSTMLRKNSLRACLLKASVGRSSAKGEALFLEMRTAVAVLDREGVVLRKALERMPFVLLARRLLAELPDYQHKTGLVPAACVPALVEQSLSGDVGATEAFCRLGSRLTHILVDEFQDTSLDQWAALRPLVKEALSRGGSLTIVGDVKQAIYHWRGGEAALFDDVPEDPDLRCMVPRPDFDVLSFNRRSRKKIVDWNNAIFAPLADPDTARHILGLLLPDSRDGILAEAAARLSATFASARQRTEKSPEGGRVRVYRLPAGTSAHAHLASLLPDIVVALGTSRPWKDIAILVRDNEQATQAAAWLRGRNVPVVTQGSLRLADQPLIAQTVALLAFLDTPDDDLAFWTVLIGDDLLPPLDLFPAIDAAHVAFFQNWAAQRAASRQGGLAHDFREDFPAAWQSLFAPLLDHAGLLTPYDTVREIFRHWRVEERYPQSGGFLLRFLEVLHNAEQRGLTDLAGFLDHWRKHGHREKAPLPAGMDAVSIMTIHKAKGLQFDVVLTPWLDFPVRAGGDTVYWENGNGLGVLAPLSAAMGAPFAQALADAAREALHLLYVAWTRAVSELHCFLPAAQSGRMAAVLENLLAAVPAENRSVHLRLPDAAKKPGNQKLPAVSGEADSAAPARYAGNADNEEVWRPMNWLPRLRIFRTPLEDGTFTAKRRGTLMHYCLEHLFVTGNPEADALNAVTRGMASFPLPLHDKETATKQMCAALSWYAALPESAVWTACGTPEHALLDEEGRMRRVDLLVDDGQKWTAVEYKSGTTGTLPAPEHAAQLHDYLRLLRRAVDRPVGGALVYPDRREYFLVEAHP